MDSFGLGELFRIAPVHLFHGVIDRQHHFAAMVARIDHIDIDFCADHQRLEHAFGHQLQFAAGHNADIAFAQIDQYGCRRSLADRALIHLSALVLRLRFGRLWLWRGLGAVSSRFAGLVRFGRRFILGAGYNGFSLRLAGCGFWRRVCAAQICHSFGCFLAWRFDRRLGAGFGWRSCLGRRQLDRRRGFDSRFARAVFLVTHGNVRVLRMLWTLIIAIALA